MCPRAVATRRQPTLLHRSGPVVATARRPAGMQHCSRRMKLGRAAFCLSCCPPVPHSLARPPCPALSTCPRGCLPRPIRLGAGVRRGLRPIFPQGDCGGQPCETGCNLANWNAGKRPNDATIFVLTDSTGCSDAARAYQAAKRGARAVLIRNTNVSIHSTALVAQVRARRPLRRAFSRQRPVVSIAARAAWLLTCPPSLSGSFCEIGILRDASSSLGAGDGRH